MTILEHASTSQWAHRRNELHSDVFALGVQHDLVAMARRIDCESHVLHVLSFEQPMFMGAYLLSVLPAQVCDPVHMFPAPVEGGLRPKAVFYHNRDGRVVSRSCRASLRAHAPHGPPFPTPHSILPSSAGIMQAHLFRSSLRGPSSLRPDDVRVLPDTERSSPRGCSGHRCLSSIRPSGAMRFRWRSGIVLGSCTRCATSLAF